jgi:hypothetical protein
MLKLYEKMARCSTIMHVNNILFYLKLNCVFQRKIDEAKSSIALNGHILNMFINSCKIKIIIFNEWS